MKRKIFQNLVLNFLLITSFAYGKNGIPIDKIQNDPYFMNGSALEQEESDENESSGLNESGTQGGAQMDPNKPDFYNKENWSGGIKGEDDSFSIQNDSEKNNAGSTSDTEEKSSAENQDYTQNQQEENQLLKTDQDLRLPGTFLPSNCRLNFSLNYTAFYSPSFTEDFLQSYFNDFAGFNFKGLSFSGEYIFKGKSDIHKFSLGLLGSWSLLESNADRYNISADKITGDLTLGLKFFHKNRNQVNIFFGAGILYIYNMFLEYSNGLKSETTNWLYPDVVAGGSYNVYIYNHFGGTAGLTLHWPVFTKGFFPQLEINIGMVTRF